MEINRRNISKQVKAIALEEWVTKGESGNRKEIAAFCIKAFSCGWLKMILVPYSCHNKLP